MVGMESRGSENGGAKEREEVEILEGTVRGTKDGEGDRMGIWRWTYGNVYN